MLCSQCGQHTPIEGEICPSCNGDKPAAAKRKCEQRYKRYRSEDHLAGIAGMALIGALMGLLIDLLVFDSLPFAMLAGACFLLLVVGWSESIRRGDE
jgi:hypothetical protein